MHDERTPRFRKVKGPGGGDDAVKVGYVDCSSDDKHMLHPGIFLILAFPSQWKL
jgi:hypothetical protein